ncbi:MAG: hypothetical protein KJ049_07090 [Gammaproteobacteria bacterium]|nr:hypothetical protein [Gammaproteobacteria bacterium]
MTRRSAGLAWLIVAVATVLPAIFLEYRVQEIHAAASAPDYIDYSDRLIVPLGYTSLAAEPGSALSMYGGKIGAERGIYGRPAFSWWAAVVCGVVIPLGLIGLGGYLAIRKGRS